MSSMNNGNKQIDHLRFFCQKVLPLVYDDSLSYYELLCKVVKKLNEIIDLVNGSDFEDYIRDLIEKYFDKIMMDVMYDESTETITFKRKEKIVVTGDSHVYNPNTNTMEITDEE